MNWICTHKHIPAWEMKPGRPSRLRTQELPCISVPFFIFLSPTLSLWVLPPDSSQADVQSQYINTPLWFLTHFHHDGSDCWKEGMWWLQTDALISIPGSSHVCWWWISSQLGPKNKWQSLVITNIVHCLLWLSAMLSALQCDIFKKTVLRMTISNWTSVYPAAGLWEMLGLRYIMGIRNGWDGRYNVKMQYSNVLAKYSCIYLRYFKVGQTSKQQQNIYIFFSFFIVFIYCRLYDNFYINDYGGIFAGICTKQRCLNL